MRRTIPPMTDLPRALDDYIGALARRGCTAETRRTYRAILDKLLDQLALSGVRYPEQIESVHAERFLNRWQDAAPATLAQYVSIVRGFIRYMRSRGLLDGDPAVTLERPRRLPPEDLDVVTVGGGDVLRMFEACLDWQEFLCLVVLACLGPRRAAASKLRLTDVDFDRGEIRFREKGRKVIVKPMPRELELILLEARDAGVWEGDRDHVIPNRRPNSVSRAERSDKVVWETVRRVARRAGVEAHPHALRAAFAVQFEEQHPKALLALKDLMGHARLETTMVYLRRRDKRAGMEEVRDLSWGFALPPQAGEAHTGFEPVLPASALSEPFRRKLSELRAQRSERRCR